MNFDDNTLCYYKDLIILPNMIESDIRSNSGLYKRTWIGSEPSLWCVYNSRVSLSIANHFPDTQPTTMILPSGEKAILCACS